MLINSENYFKKVGIIGSPISHSLSPYIHNYWLKHYNINGNYVPIEVKKNELGKALDKIKKNNFLGFNVTIPFKEKIIHYLDKLDKNSQNIGAVNTVIIKPDGKLVGKNTDWYGFLENLKSSFPKFEPASGPVVVLGAGGASRSICFTLKLIGCKEIRILSRRLIQAQRLSQDLDGCAIPFNFSDQEKAFKEIIFFINTTPMGMPNYPWKDINLSLIPKEVLIYDIVYKPEKTFLIKTAEKNGNNVLGGIGMLLYQASPAFEYWFGKKPIIDKKLEKIINDKLWN